MIEAKPSVRRCENPACGAVLTRGAHEGPGPFSRRKYCDNDCRCNPQPHDPAKKALDMAQREIDRENQMRRDEIGNMPLAEVVERLHPSAAWLFR